MRYARLHLKPRFLRTWTMPANPHKVKPARQLTEVLKKYRYLYG